jgi:hypothetical protein
MTLTQLIADQYDIDCNSEEEVKQVVDVLKRNGVKESPRSETGTAIWLFASKQYALFDKLSAIEKTISATDFLKLNL